VSTISNYNAVFTYNFTPVGPTAGVGGTISGMTVGTNYTVIASEGSCVSAPSASFNNSPPLAPPVITITGTLTHCNGGTTTITGNGGVSYVWDDAGSSTTASIAVTQGTYTVTGTNASGCTGTATAVVTESAPFPITFTGFLNHCTGETTTVTANGGSTYVWAHGPTTAAVALTQGTYTVTATNSAGCISSDDVTITETTPPIADFILLDACDGDPVLFLDLSFVATGTITGWDWDFGDNTSSTLQDPAHVYPGPGVYDVTLVASSGSCTGTVTYQAFVYDTPVADFTTANVCLGEPADFLDNSTVANGTIVDWAWDFAGLGTANGSPSASFTFANAGTYPVTLAVLSSDMCFAVHTENITIYPTPVAAFTAPDVCEGQPTVFTNQSTVSSGTIALNAWDLGDLNQSANASPTHTYATSGTYTVTLGAASNFGCIGITSQDVTVNPLPSVNASHTDILCAGQTNGTATAAASGSTPPYSYQWNNVLQSTTSTIQNLSAGPYNVTVTDARGCRSDTTVIVQQPLPINVTMVAGNDTCAYGNGNIQAIMLGGTAPFEFVWSAIRDSSSLFFTPNPNTGWNTGLSPGAYSVVITDAGGCSIQGSATVGAIPPPVANFSTRSKPEELKDPAVQFFNESTAATSYQWSFGDGDLSMQQHPVHDYDSSGIYLVMLIAYNEPRYGCADTAYRYVEVEPLFTFYIPNSFTPDGDQLNDTWGPKGDNFEYESYNVQVYDRWGKLVWQTDSPERQWNGLHQSSLEPVPQGTYIYQFVLRQFNTFEPKQITGSITVYRN